MIRWANNDSLRPAKPRKAGVEIIDGRPCSHGPRMILSPKLDPNDPAKSETGNVAAIRIEGQEKDYFQLGSYIFAGT